MLIHLTGDSLEKGAIRKKTFPLIITKIHWIVLLLTHDNIKEFISIFQKMCHLPRLNHAIVQNFMVKDNKNFQNGVPKAYM